MSEYFVLVLTFCILILSIPSHTYSASSTSTDSKSKVKTKTESVSSISLPLYARSSLVKHQHKDYQSLTLSRLRRDSARVELLNAKLNFAVNGFNLSSMKPADNAAILPEDISAPITSGYLHGSGEYFVRIGVGTPAKSYYMVIDTGSDINWLQCLPCTKCYKQSGPFYNRSGSSTDSPLSCKSPQCNSVDSLTCIDGTCHYEQIYGDKSKTSGDIITETVSFGNSGSVPNVAIGCGHNNKGLYSYAAGLIGLGGGKLSLLTQIKAKSFSFCLVNRYNSSSSTLDFNSALPQNAVTAPLLPNYKMETYMYVGLSGISVDGKLLLIPPSNFAVDKNGSGGTIVDTGTTVTRLQSDAYTSLRKAFIAGTRNLPSSTSTAEFFDTCYDLSLMTSAVVPSINFHFTGGKTLALPRKNILIVEKDAKKFCLAFARANTSLSLSIIGNVQLQGIRVSYDLADAVVGFSPDSC